MARLDLPSPPWIVGHRGAAGEELENTLESVLLAVDQGADMVEIDVQFTADHGLAVFHDWTLDRLTGRSETVEKTRLGKLCQIPLKAPGGNRRQIPDLNDLLAKTPETVTLNLELKRRDADRRLFASSLLNSIRGRRRFLVSSFDWELLAVLKSLDPGLALAPLAKKNRTALVRAGDRLGAVSLHAHRALATAYLMRQARRSGRPVLAYTVNDVREARNLLDLGVSGFFTDSPGKLRRLLGLTPSQATQLEETSK
ncbi:MAG: glycerophosphodiester phosphodiesterase [Acidobacteriota bacterium]|nr:glycerophosphodiester phosphodiesterase [Acidobacteriota bacterium]